MGLLLCQRLGVWSSCSSCCHSGSVKSEPHSARGCSKPGTCHKCLLQEPMYVYEQLHELMTAL